MPADLGQATMSGTVRAITPSPSGRRAAAIVTVGFKSEDFVPGQGTLSSFVRQPERDDVERLVDAIRSTTASGAPALAIYPRWDPEPALRRLETANAAVGGASIGLYGTALPPLAGAVLASLASAAAAHVPATGILHAGLPALESELMVYAWLGSVAGLSSPAPTLAQHLMSLSPNTSFGVSVQPEPLIRRLTRSDRGMPVPTTYRPMCLAVAARDVTGRRWVEEVIARGLGSPPLKHVEETPHGPKWWGTPKLAEAVAYPIDVPVVARRISQNLTPTLCRWCGQAIASERCPFCGLDTSGERALRGTS
jgi:hypothetical protein